MKYLLSILLIYNAFVVGLAQTNMNIVKVLSESEVNKIFTNDLKSHLEI